LQLQQAFGGRGQAEIKSGIGATDCLRRQVHLGIGRRRFRKRTIQTNETGRKSNGFCARFPGKKRRRWITLAVLAIASLGALSAFTACGGGFGLVVPQSKAATYTLTITGTSGSVQQSTTVQLTVE
jgi:hypothetical protein